MDAQKIIERIAGVEIRSLERYCDERGWLCELFRRDELPEELLPAMAYVSMTLPQVVRGPHEHRGQTDYFGFVGPGTFEVYLWDNRPDSPTYGVHVKFSAGQENPCVVVIPPGVVHAYKNVSSAPGLVFNAPNRLYRGEGKKEQVDEIRWEDDPDSPFKVR